MAAKKRMTKKEREQRHRRRFWAGILLVSLAAAFCVLVTLSEQLASPFLPTWKEIFQKAGLAEADPLDSELRVHVIDVGNADAILVRNKEASLLIDAGERDDGETVLAYLQRQGVDKLDMVIATHADADHIGGMKMVINGIDIGAFLMATMPEGHTPTTKTYTGMLEALAGKGLKITEAKPGTRYPLGDATLDILGPAAEFEENNNQSVVCKVTFGAKRFLFMGDAEKQAEAELLSKRLDLSADVIKVGHHGSDTSTTDKLLDAVKPRYAFVTCGAGNSYGHPDKQTMDKLKARGVTAYRSDLNGTIVAVTDGSQITITTERGTAIS